MDERERIKANIAGSMQYFREEFEQIENDMQKLQKGLKIALKLYETAQQIRNTQEENMKELCYIFIDGLQSEFSIWYTEYKNEKKANLGEWVQSIKPVMDVMKLYYALMEEQENSKDTSNIPELPAEIQDILNMGETEEAIIDDNPILRTMTRKGANIANYGEAGQIKIIEHDGKLTPFHAEVFNTAIKAYRDRKVTKEGYIVLTENQAIKTMLGTKGTPSEKQKADFRQAWDDMRNESMTYETTETLAQIIGIEQEQIEEFIPGIKPQNMNVVEEYFVQGIKVIKGQTVNGKLTDIYLIKPSDIVKKCIDQFAWFDEISPATQRVMKEDEKGELKIWGYSQQRIEMKQYLFSWVYKCKRTRSIKGENSRAKQGNISLQLPYDTIFEECGIDTTHRQARARRIDDVAVILEHLKRCGEIANWNQYLDKFGKLRGVEVTLYKERLQ